MAGMLNNSEKLDVSELENGQTEHLTRKDEIGRIDAIATAQGTTLASFAHLDEKKILRKASAVITIALAPRRLT